MRKKVADENLVPLAAAEPRQVARYRITKQNVASFHKQHQCASSHGFRDRGKQEHGVGLHRIGLGRWRHSSKAAVEHNLAMPCYENGCRMDLVAAYARLNDSRGLLKSGRGHPGSLGTIHGNQCLRKQKSDHDLHQYVRVPLTFVSMRYTEACAV